MLAEFHLIYVVLPVSLIVLALRWRGRRRTAAATMVPAAQPAGSVSFGYKASWLALRSTDPAEVAEALHLEDVHPATWWTGVEQAYSSARSVFVTPPVDGWVLALGPFGAGHDRVEDLAGLSRRFGEAQLFGTHRVSGFDEWQRWVDGEALRRYAFADGEVLFDDGERAGADAGVVSARGLEDDDDDELWPDEEMTISMARRWSIDPTTLDRRSDLPPTGILGSRALLTDE